MSLVEAPNVTLFSMGHYLHASERSGNSQGKLPMKDEVIDIEEHVTAMDMLQKENAAIKSKEDQKMTGENNA
ncbi:hypothetical protein QQP08_003435 [Theobroma cacao]|nr:hypothetical protein QQP08_003435 [Theobroma cacao]